MKNGFRLFSKVRGKVKEKEMVGYRTKKIERLELELKIARLEKDLEKVKKEFREFKKGMKV